jgi:hypothetical protein
MEDEARVEKEDVARGGGTHSMQRQDHRLEEEQEDR